MYFTLLIVLKFGMEVLLFVRKKYRLLFTAKTDIHAVGALGKELVFSIKR